VLDLWLLKPLLLLLKTHIYPNFDVEGEKKAAAQSKKIFQESSRSLSCLQESPDLRKSVFNG
jgi:hypothetical protein